MPGGTSEFVFSTDPSSLDADWVHNTLAEHAYWAQGRSRERQDTANAASRCYAVNDVRSGAQVAFARVVTDEATFAWLCDVIVDPAVRGRGLGKLLVAGVIDDLERLGLQRIVLSTGDAHALYARHGWAPLDNPERWMERST
jgi:GNAT superfamily N-acetyltransferase